MIHYHGGPVTPVDAARELWTRRHAFVSFAHPSQAPLAAEVCHFALDCGAFTVWKAGEGTVDVTAYATWVRKWERHPGFDFAIIPDVIDGSEFDNDQMLAKWITGERMRCASVPVWHLHESFERLELLVRGVLGGVYARVALGSSGKWATPGTDDWWERMEEVRPALTDEDGCPLVKLHGLRMLNPTIFAHIPFSSADSCNVALNIGMDTKWPKGPYSPMTAKTRALVLAERIELHATANRWSKRRGIQQNLELLG